MSTALVRCRFPSLVIVRRACARSLLCPGSRRKLGSLCCAFAALQLPAAAAGTRLKAEEAATARPNLVRFTKSKSELTLFQALRQWFHDAFSTLRTCLRACQLAVICAPLFALTPLALWWPRVFLERWCDVLVWTLETCGPVSTKLGQWASTRRDLFPTELCRRLSRLQRRTNPHAWKHTEAALIDTLGEDYRSRFSEFERDPIGSGCCAQVYRAQIAGQDVAVKVLHPDIEDLFRRDLRVASAFASVALWLFPSLKWVSPRESLREFASMMTGQVDLRVEASNLARFHDNFGDSDTSAVIFPRPMRDLSGKKVLVETFEVGENMDEFVERLVAENETKAVAEIRKAVASAGVEMLLKMVSVHFLV